MNRRRVVLVWIVVLNFSSDQHNNSDIKDSQKKRNRGQHQDQGQDQGEQEDQDPGQHEGQHEGRHQYQGHNNWIMTSS